MEFKSRKKEPKRRHSSPTSKNIEHKVRVNPCKVVKHSRSIANISMRGNLLGTPPPLPYVTENPNKDDHEDHGIAKRVINKSNIKPILEKYHPHSVINLRRCMYKLLQDVAVELRMEVVRDDNDEDWDVFWSDVFIATTMLKNFKLYHRVNHIPGLVNLESKAFLAHHLNRMRAQFPDDYDFFPRSWSLPWQCDDLLKYMKHHPSEVFISKPTRGAEGKGIKVFNTIEEARKLLTHTSVGVTQLYIPSPLLIDGFKFDLRLYALITCIDPLRIFVYNNGLVRLATCQYVSPNSSNINNQYMHLTNYSINKYSDTYDTSPENGSKRDFTFFSNWLLKQGHNKTKLWNDIDDIVVKTTISVYPILKETHNKLFPHTKNVNPFFEILGFDVLIGSNLKPYLLEVNRSPSFKISGEIDDRVKRNLLMDTFELLNLSENRRSILGFNNNMEKDSDFSALDAIVKDQTSPDAKIKKISSGENTATVSDQIKWERRHMGNFRLIYPSDDSYIYLKFIHYIFSVQQISDNAHCANRFKTALKSQKKRKPL